MTIDREDMQTRRLEAADDIRHGATQQRIAIKYGVSRTSASRWMRAVKTGASLASKQATGRPMRLDEKQLRKLEARIESTPESASKLRAWIEETFGVHYNTDHIYRLLRYMRGRKNADRAGDVRPVHAEPKSGRGRRPTAF